MSREFSLVIRGATVVDGTGEKPFEAAIGIVGDRIAAVGRVAGAGSAEIEARGMMVMHGFVDIHTHYIGQATWANRHGTTSPPLVTRDVPLNCAVRSDRYSEG